jgi:hypothetical protein
LDPDYVEKNQDFINKLFGDDNSNAFAEIEMKRIDVSPEYKLP